MRIAVARVGEHIIAMRQTQPLQRALVNAQGWWVLQDKKGQPVEGIELTRFAYQPEAWSKPRARRNRSDWPGRTGIGDPGKN